MSQTSPTWPKRTAICLDCRTTLADRRESHAQGHTVVSLKRSAGREQLIDRVWGVWERQKGRSSPRSWAVEAVAIGIAAAGIAMVLLPFGHPGIGMLMALVAGTGKFLFTEATRARAIDRRVRATPLPGAKPPPRLSGGSSIVGTVSSGDTAPSPLTGTEAVAFSVTLATDAHYPAGSLNDGATLGFTITTAEGDTIEIPRGHIEIITHGKPLTRRKKHVERYLRDLDPLRARSDDKDPFQHRHAAEVAIQIGDHIALHNPIHRIAFDTSGPTPGYREAARQIFAIDGIPCIELLP